VGLALDVPLKVGEVLRIVLHRLEILLLLDHHQAGGVGHIAPLLEVDGEGVGVRSARATLRSIPARVAPLMARGLVAKSKSRKKIIDQPMAASTWMWA
jgi:hypothetical protein